MIPERQALGRKYENRLDIPKDFTPAHTKCLVQSLEFLRVLPPIVADQGKTRGNIQSPPPPKSQIRGKQGGNTSRGRVIFKGIPVIREIRRPVVTPMQAQYEWYGGARTP